MNTLVAATGVSACWHWWGGPGSYQHCHGTEVPHLCHCWHSPEAVTPEGPRRSRSRILARHQLPGCHKLQVRCVASRQMLVLLLVLHNELQEVVSFLHISSAVSSHHLHAEPKHICIAIWKKVLILQRIFLKIQCVQVLWISP